MINAAVGDISGPVTTAVAGLQTEVTAVAAAALGIGVVTFGLRRAWGFFKSLTK